MSKGENCKGTCGINLNRKAQTAVFVIVAIAIVAAIILVFVFKDSIFSGGVSPEFSPVYTLYSLCIEEKTKSAIDILGTQGGRIDTGSYVPGSEYAPFSSHLNFLGIPVPYWYYVSGNNVITENIPSRSEMEEEVSEFLRTEIGDCDFSEFYEQGFWVELPDSEDVKVKTRISDNKVEVDVSSVISVSREDRSARKTKHNVEVVSKTGKFYEIARDIYNKEADEAFLEEYAVDVLRNYAPVDGVEVQCGPKVWQTREVVDELKQGLEANLRSVKFRGNYYRSDDPEDEYFVVNLPVSEQVNLLYSKNWPTSVEVTPADEEVMIAGPIGNQEGLGVIGFCYVPYHFVYDVNFPVLIQISDGFEIFQFPVAVVLEGNQPRDAEFLENDLTEESDVCQFKEGNVRVQTFDNRLNPVEADVSYKCFDQTCYLGRSQILGSEAVLDAEIPVCVNGKLIAESEGFARQEKLFSSNSESFTDIILDKEYELEVEVRVDGIKFDRGAIVSFKGDGSSGTAVLPDNNKVDLMEGEYEVSAFVYGDSRISIPSSFKTQCYEVPRGGLFGFFGSTKEECIQAEIPAVDIDYALIGGGKLSTYILESELQGGKIVVNVDSFPVPGSLEDLQYNYEAFDVSTVEVSFA